LDAGILPWVHLTKATNRADARLPLFESDKASFMSGFKEPSFADRQKAALQAKQNILNKFKAAPGPDDPDVKRRQAEREAQAAVRAKAKEAREAAKAEAKVREPRPRSPARRKRKSLAWLPSSSSRRPSATPVMPRARAARARRSKQQNLFGASSPNGQPLLDFGMRRTCVT
jgi:hypothetical protein